MFGKVVGSVICSQIARSAREIFELLILLPVKNTHEVRGIEVFHSCRGGAI